MFYSIATIVLCHLLLAIMNCNAAYYHQVGEGCGTTVGATGAVDTSCNTLDDTTAKEHGQRPKIMSKRRTTKRSFKRAFNRSLRDGFTMYHGKIYTPQDFNLPIPCSPSQVKSCPRISTLTPTGASNRLSVFLLELRWVSQ